MQQLDRMKRRYEDSHRDAIQAKLNLEKVEYNPKVCLFVCLFVSLFVCLFVCLFVYLFVCLFIILFTYCILTGDKGGSR